MKQCEQRDMEQPEDNCIYKLLCCSSRPRRRYCSTQVKDSPRMVPRNVQEGMLFHYSRFITLFDTAGGTLTPKSHLMYHAIFMIDSFGSPKYFATYVDESCNGVIAVVARSCHRLTWADSIIRKLGAIQQLDARSPAGFRH